MKKLLTFFLVLCLSVSAFSQTKKNPWAIGSGLNWNSFSNNSLSFFDQVKKPVYYGGLIEASASRYFNQYFNMQLSVSHVSLSTGSYKEYAITSVSAFNIDADWQVKLLSGILDQDSRITPYLYLGVGYQNINYSGYFKRQIGLGIDIKVAKEFSIYAREDYVSTTEQSGLTYLHPHIGLKWNFGNKDKDNDGILDKDDRCPDVFGLAAFKGCPDTDRDGVPDVDDKCPNTPANMKVDIHGCPIDSDKDGVSDSLDQCPRTPAGVKVDEKGCPVDSDKDGVADYVDKCQDTPEGVKVDAKGCPVDTDNDGVADYLDKCPDTPAKVKVDANGCPPDFDKDGVPDYLDKCPKVPGIPANHGCPEITRAEKEKIIKIQKAIYFATGKDIIKKESEAPLTELIPILTKYPEMKLRIEGNTDNVGDDNSNLILSQKRADAVMKFLVNLGISAARLTAIGYGETKPIDDNNTDAGRATNRRVDLITEY